MKAGWGRWNDLRDIMKVEEIGFEDEFLMGKDEGRVELRMIWGF